MLWECKAEWNMAQFSGNSEFSGEGATLVCAVIEVNPNE